MRFTPNDIPDSTSVCNRQCLYNENLFSGEYKLCDNPRKNKEDIDAACHRMSVQQVIEMLGVEQ